MNDKQLKSLIKTVEYGSFSMAAEAIFLSKQALKKQIDALEEEVGFSLLVRTHQGISLTPAGEEFCRGTRKILDEMNSVTKKCKELAFHEQIIRIEAPNHPRLLLENTLGEFMRRFPYIKQQIILQSSTKIIDDIIEDRTDVAEYTYRSDVENSGVQYLKLFPLSFKCLVAPSHPLAGNKTIQLKELSGYRVGLHMKNTDLLSRMNECCRDLSPEVMGNDMQKIINICYNGGIFISKAYFLNSMQPLIPIRLETDLIPMAIILYRQSPSPIVREFLSVVQDIYPQESPERM
jgi:DNA-binding transcriptional LysR family regulator